MNAFPDADRAAPTVRSRLAAGLLVTALVLFLAALHLHVDQGGRVRGYDGLWFILKSTVTDFGASARSAVRAAILLANLQAVVAAVLLVAGYRTGGRVAAVVVAVLAWGVSAYFTVTSGDLLGDMWKLATQGPGAFAWFGCVTALAGASAAWPRPVGRGWVDEDD